MSMRYVWMPRQEKSAGGLRPEAIFLTGKGGMVPDLRPLLTENGPSFWEHTDSFMHSILKVEKRYGLTIFKLNS